MISVIIASVNKELLSNVSENIAKTIGVAFEILSYDNTVLKKGLCELYNDAARTAKYDVLCFMHEDVEIKTANWGNTILKNFADPKLGVIGLAGGTYKAMTPSGWGATAPSIDTRYLSYIQSFKDVKVKAEERIVNHSGKAINQVACVDGMWFCTLKKIVNQFPFDEQLCTGFHGYDIDFCLQVSDSYKIAVSSEILIEHFSEGSFNKEWMETTLKLHQKWHKKLPYYVEPFKVNEIRALEKKSFQMLVINLIGLNYPLTEIVGILNRYYKRSLLGTSLRLKMLFFILKCYFQKK